jgi:hypothetical protein
MLAEILSGRVSAQPAGRPPPRRQKVPLQLIMAKTRQKSFHTAMRHVKPGDAAVAEIASLLGPPRRSH